MTLEMLLIIALGVLCISLLSERDHHARRHVYTRPEPDTLPPTKLPPAALAEEEKP